VADTHGSGGAGDAGKIVMFRQPETPIPGSLGALCQVECVRKCVSGVKPSPILARSSTES
jgi:hypothetical protein